jgi:hypothetical protein
LGLDSYNKYLRTLKLKSKILTKYIPNLYMQTPLKKEIVQLFCKSLKGDKLDLVEVFSELSKIPQTKP